MPGKKAYHIALSPDIHKRLRLMAAARQIAIGDIVSQLVALHADGLEHDAAQQELNEVEKMILDDDREWSDVIPHERTR